MNILIAPDSFKESLNASDVARCIKEGINQADPDVVCVCVPLADGGEGTVNSLVDATDGHIERMKVLDPLMREVNSYYGILGDGKTAVIEMAAASGLELLSEAERNPMVTSSYGTGQLIAAAIDKKIEKLIVGIGGSATNDGGAGMAQALGIDLLDKNGENIGHGGGNLHHLVSIDDSRMDPRLKDIHILVASDVKNPLCGKKGASATYGPQKGASEYMVRELDKNLAHFGRKLEQKYGISIMELPGSGAAGGLGAGLIAFLNASLEPGFEVIKRYTGLEDLIKQSDLVITGEGRMDEQTVYGKTPHGVAKLAKKFNKPVIGIAGSLGTDYQVLYREGFDALFSITNKPMSLEKALNEATELLKSTAYDLVQLINMGRGLK